MAKGFPLSEREKEYIEQTKNDKFPSVIAKELAQKFPFDNDGSRSIKTVKSFLKNE